MIIGKSTCFARDDIGFRSFEFVKDPQTIMDCSSVDSLIKIM